MLEDFPKAKLLGLSATNIRYLDNQRDIAQELFNGCIASQISLGEAIVRGILPKPLYVTTVFRYQQALQRYQQRIQNLQSAALQRKNQEYYDALRRALEKADGLDVIFKKYIRRPKGKYLVICSDYAHLQEMQTMTEPWFRQINPQVHSYVAYSSDPETSRAFRSFREDDSSALKLLFCIDMLNEGIHVKGISGVILFRPTISPIVYKQQIGRALTSGDSSTPLILDVVNNFEGLSSISAIQKEMDQAVFSMRQNGEGERIQVERFQVEEQVKDCTQLFSRLQDSLSLPWNHYFQAAGICHRIISKDGFALDKWASRQQYAYQNPGKSNCLMTEQRIALLRQIHFPLEKVDHWECRHQLVQEYAAAHGDLQVPANYKTSEGLWLSKWLYLQRQELEKRPEAAKLPSGQWDRQGKLRVAAGKRESFACFVPCWRVL